MKNPVPHRLRQVEAAALALEHVNDAQRMLVVEKPAPEPLSERFIESLFSSVSEWRMTKIVSQSDRLGQILVQTQCARDGARDAASLDRVSQPRAVVVTLRRNEHLGLVLEAPEALRMDDSITIALKR